MKGILVPADAAAAEIKELLAVPLEREVVARVTVPEAYEIPGDGPHVAVFDFGVKRNILDSLSRIGCRLTVLPAATTAEEVLALELIEADRENDLPILGICLGHQLLSLALGADTYKLKFGHRGSNQPVKNLLTGRVQISSQNHGYAVDEKSLDGLPMEITHVNVNDGTVEGMRHRELPIYSVQYHPEASPGPDDNVYLFDQFRDMLTKGLRW